MEINKILMLFLVASTKNETQYGLVLIRVLLQGGLRLQKYSLPFGLSVHAPRLWTWYEFAQDSDKKEEFPVCLTMENLQKQMAKVHGGKVLTRRNCMLKMSQMHYRLL